MGGPRRQRPAEGKATIDIRDFATDKHRSVDDTPAGGGAGMVMRADIAAASIDAARAAMPAATPTLYLSPRGKPLTQSRARELASGPGVILLCGRFEGVISGAETTASRGFIGLWSRRRASRPRSMLVPRFLAWPARMVAAEEARGGP
jgi:hypothetical protein